jgi:hypothetical protein
MSISSMFDFRATSASTVPPTSRSSAAGSKSSGCTSILPASIFEMSSTSLMSDSRWRALELILRRSSRTASPPGRSPASSSSISA